MNAPCKPLYQEVTRAALLGLVVNLTLGLAKLIGGVVGSSFALIADAVNSLGDVVTTLVVLYAFRVAQQPADAEHPYGHTRAEGIAASNVAVLIIVSALLVGWEAVQRITIPHDVPPVWTLWIAGANVLIKEALYQYKVRVGRRTGSAAIIANAWDHRSDALCAWRCWSDCWSFASAASATSGPTRSPRLRWSSRLPLRGFACFARQPAD